MVTIKDRVECHKMYLLYKCGNGLTRQYLIETFSSVKHEHQTRTRSHNRLTRQI